MIWVAATLLLVVAAPFVLWPLLSHWTPEAGAAAEVGEGEVERLQLEELELDLASGRLSEGEAASRRRQGRA